MDKIIGKTFEIDVTSKDIEDGEPIEYDFCPIALATNRVMYDVFGVFYNKCAVTKKSIVFSVGFGTPNFKVFRYFFTNDISKWVSKFDKKESVEPINIKISTVSKPFEDEYIGVANIS